MKVIQFIRVNHLFNRVALVSAAGLFLLVALLCLPISKNELETKATTGTAAESSITMNFTSSTASVDLTVNNGNGTFATSGAEDKAAFSVTTDNYTGYTLSISASDDTGTLLNGSNSLDSIASNLTEAEFNTSANNGKWGYKPNKFYASNEVVDNTGDNAVFLSSPTTEATTLDVTNAANNEANEYDIALGARTDYTKPNGTYSKTFVLTAIGNPVNYSIKYNAYDYYGGTITNMPYPDTDNTQSGSTSASTITLSDSVPQLENATFVGWCTEAYEDTCQQYYEPGEELPLNHASASTTELYTIWKRRYSVNISPIPYPGDEYGNEESTPISACESMENNGLILPNDIYVESDSTQPSLEIPTTVIPRFSEECLSALNLGDTPYIFTGYALYDSEHTSRKQTADKKYRAYYDSTQNTFSPQYISFPIHSYSEDSEKFSSVTLVPLFAKQYQFDVKISSSLGGANGKEGLNLVEAKDYITEPKYIYNQETIEVDGEKIMEDGYKISGVSFKLDGEVVEKPVTLSGSKYTISFAMDTEGMHNLEVIVGVKPSLQIFKDSYCGQKAYDPRYLSSDGGANSMENVYTVLVGETCWTQSPIFPTGTLDSSNTNLPPGGTYTITNNTSTSYDYGYYNKRHQTYNYCAASAGTICHDGINQDVAQYDICPRGWKLPSISDFANFSGTSYIRDIRNQAAWSSEATTVFGAQSDIRMYGYDGELFTLFDLWGSYSYSTRNNFAGILCVKKPDQ